MSTFMDRIRAGTNVVPPRGMQITCGDFETEEASLAEFDRRASFGAYFDVYKQARGVYIAQRPGRPMQKPRIDRVLVPTAKLKALGWTAIIGVEAKKSGVKLGPLVNQALDYTWATFDLKDPVRFPENVYPEAIFIWPVFQTTNMEGEGGIDGESFGNAIQSVMVQNKIGNACVYDGQLKFQIGCTVLGFGGYNEMIVKPDRLDCLGKKVGSR